MLTMERVKVEQRPVVYICHSTGGIVLKSVSLGHSITLWLLAHVSEGNEQQTRRGGI